MRASVATEEDSEAIEELAEVADALAWRVGGIVTAEPADDEEEGAGPPA